MTTSDHDESKPRRRWPTYVAVVVVLLLVVYPLSVGPALAIVAYFEVPFHQIEPLFAPLFYVVDKTGTLELFTAYINWWMANTP